MGKKSSPSPAPAPQPVVQIPQAPTMSQNISEYIANYPKLFDLQKQYGPQEAQLGLDLLKQFGPQYDAYESEQQKALTPYTYGLQEQLAKMASENYGAAMPENLRNEYVNQYRAEIGDNAGSGIGADYMGNRMAGAAEDYRRYYQNLGLSLINRMPMSAPSNPQFSRPGGNFGVGDLAGYNAQTYNSYLGGLTSVPYYIPQGGGGGKGGLNYTGALGGAAQGAAYGSSFGPWGTGIGAIVGGAAGLFGGR